MNEQALQLDTSIFDIRSNPLWRPAAKTPILLWRLGFQPLVGRLLVLMTVTGRQSRLPRRTVTEYHVLDGKIFVPCAFGEKAQWYKNIVADPHVTIQTARGAEHAIARRVTENGELLSIYFHMKASYDPQLFVFYLHSLGIEDTPEDFIAKKDRVFFIIFDPTDEPTPPVLEADLAWLWLLVLPLALGAFFKGALSQNRKVDQ